MYKSRWLRKNRSHEVGGSMPHVRAKIEVAIDPRAAVMYRDADHTSNQKTCAMPDDHL